MYEEASAIPDGEARKAAVRWAMRSESKERIKAMVELAKSEPGIPITPEELDGDGWLLNVENGTLDLRTGDLQPHSREDLISPFLQEYAGYCLTSYTGEQKTLWLVGVPGGGKSTLITGFQALFGPLAGELTPTDVVRQFGLAKIEGKRLLVTTEINEKTLQNTPTLNRLVDGGRITIEHKFRKPYEVENRAKIIWAMNDLPRITSVNDGIFRRGKNPITREGWTTKERDRSERAEREDGGRRWKEKARSD